jgi:chromate reductase, NAD(P)H dehydrogenase (quinone)
VNVVGISGSLQARSSNRALIEAARALGGEGVAVREYRGVDGLPHFNPDLDRDIAPPSVAQFRELVGAADGVLIATPEYAFGVPGALKNALDWLVGSGDLYEKPVAVLSAAPSAERGGNARADLERTLRGQGARVIASTTIVVPNGQGDRVMSDSGARDALEAVLHAFLDARASPHRLVRDPG